MSSSTSEPHLSPAVRVAVTKDALAVDLADGRTVIALLAWYPRLLHATSDDVEPCERARDEILRKL